MNLAILVGEVYNKLIHVAFKSLPQRPFLLDYSPIVLKASKIEVQCWVIAVNQIRDKGEGEQVVRPPNDPPPPFVDDEYVLKQGGLLMQVSKLTEQAKDVW